MAHPQYELYRATEYSKDGQPILATAVKWVCEHDSELPTFEQVLSTLPLHLGVVVEVKVEKRYAHYATPIK